MERITNNIYKFPLDGNVYLLKKERIVIDTGRRSNRHILFEEFEKKIRFGDVKKVVFTHLHFDHIGNFDLFTDASFYASKEEIFYFKKHPFMATWNLDLSKRFKVKLNVLDRLEGFDILHVPGHTAGSIALFYKKDKILFSGDTLFFDGLFGRTDLPNSDEDKMKESLQALEKIDYRILCPGHEYRR